MNYVKSPVELGLKTDCQGIYIETNSPRIEAMLGTGYLEFGVGDTRVDAEFSTIASRMRGHESSKNLGWQHYLLDSIPNPGYRDYSLHKEIRQTFAAQLEDPVTGKRNEVFRVAVTEMLVQQFAKTKDFEPVRQWLNEKIRKCASKLNPAHEKQSVNLRNVQNIVIKKVMLALRNNGIEINFVCELAARIGKTILFLELAREMNKEFKHKAMFVMAYGVGLSVKTSYKDEISKYHNFNNMQFIDASDNDAELQYNQVIDNNKIPVVFVSLNPEAKSKYQWINKLKGTYIALLEETDFGTHTDSQVEKVDYILKNKSVTRINASGTNIGRLAKAFGKNAIDEIISVPYCMVEQDPSIPNLVTRKFYNMLFNDKINKLLEDFDKGLLPNITKILSKPLSQQKFISALFQDLFGYQPIYGFNISEQTGEEINHSMLFVNIPKLAMEQLSKVIEKACPEHKVLILNGDYTDNKEAEGLTKEELIRLENGYYPGRDKLLVITNMMGTRSYSIPEIQACLFMQEGGDVYPYMQKYSRCLTPGFNKKYGYIFDFAFDQSKTRNTVMAVAVEAALLIREKGKTYPDAVREVLNSVNIKDMVNGKWMDADEIIKQFEDNNKLLEIANAHTRITIEDLTSDEIEAFGELAKRSTNSKKDQSKIDKLIATGKTFDTTGNPGSKAKKNPIKEIVEKAIRMINGSATTVLALGNYQGDSFLECMDIIEADANMASEFFELYGVGPATIKRLSDRLEISTLDMIVRMSKYNTTQKHIENNALAILKDDTRLWDNILHNKEMYRFIKSKKCNSILVVAGGHGSEIDSLVNMFGADIVNKIVYNDKYSFFCNQIKRKYPDITVIKGDFTELEFSMKFDVIVGNPPYQGNNNKSKDRKQPKSHNLWSKFITSGVKVLNDDGYIAFVTPDSWMSPNSQVLPLFKDNSLIWVDTTVDKYFTVSSSFSAWIMQKNKNTKSVLIDGLAVDIDKLLYLPRNFAKTFPIHDKVINSNEPKLNVLSDNTCHSDFKYKNLSDTENSVYKYKTFHTNAQTKFSKKQSIDFLNPKIIWTLSGYFKPFFNAGNLGTTEVCQYILANEDDATIILSYLNSKLYQYIICTGKWSGYSNGKVISFLPKLAHKMWTDEEIYKHFNLTQQEIDCVEAEVEKAKSKNKPKDNAE